MKRVQITLMVYNVAATELEEAEAVEEEEHAILEDSLFGMPEWSDSNGDAVSEGAPEVAEVD